TIRVRISVPMSTAAAPPMRSAIRVAAAAAARLAAFLPRRISPMRRSGRSRSCSASLADRWPDRARCRSRERLRLIRAVSVLEKNAERSRRTISRPTSSPRGTSSFKKGEPPRGFVGPRVTEPETECQGGESRFRAGFPGLSGLAGRPRPGPPGQPAPGRARLAPPRTSSSAASMFETLSERLNGALQRVTGRGRITEDNVRDTVRQIRMALLEADVALPVVKRIVERVRQRALGAEVARSLNPGQTFV